MFRGAAQYIRGLEARIRELDAELARERRPSAPEEGEGGG